MAAGNQGIEPRWHLHVSVPLGIIGAILFQAACFVWYAAQLDSKIQQTFKEVIQLEAWKTTQESAFSALANTQSQQGQKLDDLVVTAHHTNDLVERYVYKK